MYPLRMTRRGGDENDLRIRIGLKNAIEHPLDGLAECNRIAVANVVHTVSDDHQVGLGSE